MDDEAAPRAGLDILDKADAVLRALEVHGELGANELAQAVDEPTSSTYRLLTSLTALEFVEPGSRRGMYRLGVQLLRIGSAVEDGLDVREAAVPVLRGLLAETGLTSFLCIRVDTRAVCVERFEGREVRSLALRLGQSLPLHRGAAPLALLSALPESERSAVLDEMQVPSEEGVDARIAEIRERGYAVSDGDVTPGIAAMGAPILDHRGEVAAALSVSGLRAQVLDPATDAAARVVAAAASVSTALGFEGKR